MIEAAAQVADNSAQRRFELAFDGGTAIAAYENEGGKIVFTHTEVPPELEGRGVGTRLIVGALAICRERGVKIVPACSFVRRYVDEHPEVNDLVAT